MGLAALPLFLVFVQPDIGTALVYAAALAAALFVGGVRWSHLGDRRRRGADRRAARALGAARGRHAGVLKAYQQDRLTGFSASSTPTRAGRLYNIFAVDHDARRRRAARPRCLGARPRLSLNDLPSIATDFVFASFGEQRGFLGASILLLLYLLVVWRGLKVIAVARDLFGAIAAGAIVFMFLFQIFVNAGMTMGIAPITGIPLPFMSYGGSSMVTNLLAIGILLSIHARRRPAQRAARR